jgi:hypothetical protein
VLYVSIAMLTHAETRRRGEGGKGFTTRYSLGKQAERVEKQTCAIVWLGGQDGLKVDVPLCPIRSTLTRLGLPAH